MRSITVAERRSRLAHRHRLAAAHRADDVVDAARSVVCLHGTDSVSVVLSAYARTKDMSVADLEHALYVERSLVKHLAMRRTLFVFPRATLGIAHAAVGERIAGRERRVLIQAVEKAGLHADGARWLSEARAQVMEALADGRQATSSELRDELPSLRGSIAYGAGKSWGGSAAVGPRVLLVLSAEGLLVRATNAGDWAMSRPRWATARSWLGQEIASREESDGVTMLVERWLERFGPGTETDIKWWLGSTLSAVRKALADLQAVEVDLAGQVGYVLRDDVEPTEPAAPWGVLLPALDPTPMGWFDRDWYLGPYRAALVDSTGNVGPTVWWNGRIVGGWRQTAAGEVVLQMLEDVGEDALGALRDEAARLTEWLGGRRVLPRFPSPLSRTDQGARPGPGG